MARFTIIRGKRSPNWALSLLASFPYDRNAEYPDQERAAMLNTVLQYAQEFRYKRRNAMQQLGVTHFFITTDSTITISTCNGVPQLTISLI